MQSVHTPGARRPHKPLRASARIRQLSSLEETGPHLAPLLLRELRDVLGFDSGGFMHPGAGGTLDAYMESPDAQAVIPLYFEPAMQQQVRTLTRGYEEAAACEFGPVPTPQLVKVPWSSFVRSDFYNQVLRPAAMEQCVSLMPRRPDGTPVGALKMYRANRTPAFQAADLQRLAPLEPFLARALEPRTQPASEGDVALGTEMLVATMEGRLLWMSPRGEEWLALAFGHHWRRRSCLPDGLAGLLQRLRWIRDGHAAEAPPELARRTARGLFTVRACVLAATQEAGHAVGIHVTWQVSRTVRLLGALQKLSLPPRQAEVAYQLALGHPESEIAQRTALSPHTVVYHRRQIYASLSVSNRRELVARLLAG